MAIGIDGAMVLVDQELISPGITLPAQATIDLMTVGGAQKLLISGPNQTSLLSFGLETTGALGTDAYLAGGPAGVIGAQAGVQVGGTTYVYTVRNGSSTIEGYAMDGSGRLSLTAQLTLNGDQSGTDIGAMTSVTIGGVPYLISLSNETDAVRCFRVGPSGELTQTVGLGAAQGLGINDPSAVETVIMGGQTYLLVASASSSSVSVIAVEAGGVLRAVDHVIDTLDTRFQGVQALATAEIGDRVFVVAGGGDGGLNLFMMAPDGRMIVVATALHVPGLALDNITAMTAHVVDGEIELFVAGEGTGITRLRLDPGPLAPRQQGGDEAETLSGGADDDFLWGEGGNDLLAGGSGEDIIGDGAGSDTMFGGAGQDIFVLAQDGEIDRIADFQLGIDRIDLSAWGRVYDIADLSITATATGALVTFRGEVLEILSANGLPIQAHAFRTADFFPLWHALPEPQAPDSAILGTIQADMLLGTDGDDYFLASIGQDTLVGGDGFDTVSYLSADGGLRVNLAAPTQNTRSAAGHSYLQIEGVVGSRFNDTLIGDDGDNWLDGAGFSDQLFGGKGNDTLFGGTSNDILVGGEGADLLDGGAGRDRASYRSATSAVRVDLETPAQNQGEAAGDLLVAIEEVEGSAFADTLMGDGSANSLFGLAGDDLLWGRLGDDTLSGGDGDDVLIGGEGADRLDGGAGFDIADYSQSRSGFRIDLITPTLTTGEAAGDVLILVESIRTTAFADTIGADDSANHIAALGGNDWISGRGGDDALFAGSGTDTLYGGSGDDALAGGSGGGPA
ncbi:MAG: hypothetical protein HC844_06520 [Tabrizicola sp.]|nr:hypothetical protein [Tabrizicola sp.]